MSTWNDVHSYIHKNYKAEDLSDGLIKLVFDVANLRSQGVFVAHFTIGDGEEWISVESIVGEVGNVDLDAALTKVGDYVVGALSRVGDYVTLKNSAPLLNLDINELVRPMLLITTTADLLEQQLSGADSF